MWDYVNGTRPAVQKPDDTDLLTFPLGAADPAYEKAGTKFRAYQKGKMKAVDLIWNFVHEDLQAEIEDTKDPKEMWNRFKKEYGT